jgi:hypothetical protein
VTAPLRIHADRQYLPPGEPHVIMLYPFWGRADVNVPRPEFVDRYVEHGREFIELVDLAACEVAVFPQNWKRGELSTPDTLVPRAQAFAAEARAAGKRYLFFRGGDSSDPLPVEGAMVLRNSLERSRRPAGEHALPAFHEDMLQHTGGTLVTRPYGARPVVGFCGLVLEQEPAGMARAAVARAKRVVLERRGLPSFSDTWVRGRALDALQRQDAVDTNIIVRDEWGGGAFPSEPPFVDADRWQRVRTEYVDNIVSSDYVLCARGHGNYSYRLYETLSLGRIPVLVDTDCVLPFDSTIDWRDYCVWVDRREIPRIGEKVTEFHERLSPGGFVELQQACRRLWETYLTPEGFFSHFHLLVR